MRMLALMILSCLVASPALAVSVKNLSGSTQSVVFEQGGQTREVIIEDGRVYRYHGYDVVLIMPGQNPIQTRTYEDYVIWPSGKLILQKINGVRKSTR